LCHDSPGLAAGTECYKPGSSALAQTRDENDDTEKEPELPTCDGSNGPKGVNCIVRK
jgi:hypothetical protein